MNRRLSVKNAHQFLTKPLLCTSSPLGPLTTASSYHTPRTTVHKAAVSPRRFVPEQINRPGYHEDGETEGEKDPKKPTDIVILEDSEGITRMRAACALARDILSYAGSLVAVGTQITVNFVLICCN